MSHAEATQTAPPPSTPRPARAPIDGPASPRSIAETGLDEGFLMDLMVKTIYRQSQERVSAIAPAIALPPAIVEKLILAARELKLMEPLGQLGASMAAEMRYGLTEKGKRWALEALSQSEWVGPCPVTIEAFRAQCARQTIRREVLTRPMLARVFRELTLSPALMEELGPAVNSGASILLYGPPGNGKSSIANAVCAAYDDAVYLPHALTLDKQVIALFDPMVHRRLDGEAALDEGLRRGSDAYDTRFVLCKRPTVETGG
ncbi:MAG: ATPase, partial [Pseudomonadota bacterium]